MTMGAASIAGGTLRNSIIESHKKEKQARVNLKNIRLERELFYKKK